MIEGTGRTACSGDWPELKSKPDLDVEEDIVSSTAEVGVMRLFASVPVFTSTGEARVSLAELLPPLSFEMPGTVS